MSLYSDLPPVNVAGRKLVGRMVFALLVVASALLGAFGGLLIVYSTDLPEVGELERFRPSAITEVYDDQGRVVGTFALQRRIIAGHDDFPPVLRDAVLAIEDKSFEKHWGVNFYRILGAAYEDIRTGSRAQGASTLTMQLSRNLFLSPDRTFRRKMQEVILAIQIERRFTKQQIFTMYANQIYLGHGIYGFAAGAQYYFSKTPKELTLEEAALLAALPKSGVIFSPINHAERALERRNLVINAMLEDGRITIADAARARTAPLRLNLQPPSGSVAPHFLEEVRQYLERKFGSDQVHEGGLRVYTTLNLDLQRAAVKAVEDGVLAYEKRHGKKASGIEAALLAIDNASGDVKAMVGGRDFERSKFNRATQAQRQTGSGFKPYVYTAAIEAGFEPDDMVTDAPVVFRTASGPYMPRNYDGRYAGPTTLRSALAHSRNIPALKLADRVGIRTVIDYAHRFGLESQIQPYLPIALGAAEATLMEQTSAFTTFPNDGVRAVPRYVRKVTDYEGRVMEENFPEVRDVVSAHTARVMTGMLEGVVQFGTAAAARSLKHPLGGETGTTNDYTDAWFIGFSPSLTAGVWIGFDEKKSLGEKETGNVAALPIWMDFMKVALAGRPEEAFPAVPEEKPMALARSGLGVRRPARRVIN